MSTKCSLSCGNFMGMAVPVLKVLLYPVLVPIFLGHPVQREDMESTLFNWF